MSENKPTVGLGLAALLGQPPVAHQAPDELPEPTIEDDDTREARLAKALVAVQALGEEKTGVNYEVLKADVDLKQQAYLAAEAVFRQAEKVLQQRQRDLDAAKRREIDANPQSAQDANAEYIRLQIAERARKAEEEQLRYDIAKKSGLFSPEQLASMCPNVSPLTQMIQNQKNIEKRAQALAGRR